MRDRLMRWMARLAGDGRPAPPGGSGRLPELLRTYPPYRTPHPGSPKALTRQQCDANLAYLLEQRPARTMALAGLVRAFGIDLAAGLAAEDPRPLLAALDAWAQAEWPDVPVAGMAGFEAGQPRWFAGDKAGPHIGLSMLMDVAIVLGDIVVARRPDYAWRLDLDRANRHMSSYRRPVVMRLAEPDGSWAAIVLDFEAIAIDACDTIARAVPGGHSLGSSVLAAIEGGYDPPAVAATTPGWSKLRPVYDKAKYHAEAVAELGLPAERAGLPAACFLGWLIERDLIAADWAARFESVIAAYRRGEATALAVYRAADGVLMESMLSEEGNAFALGYYGPGSSGPYAADFMAVAASGLDTPFHAGCDRQCQDRINSRIDERFVAWRAARPG